MMTDLEKHMIKLPFRIESIKLLFEPRDLWLGLYWDIKQIFRRNYLSLYFCFLPLLPLKIVISAERGGIICRLGHSFENYEYRRREGYKRCRRCGHHEYFNNSKS